MTKSAKIHAALSDLPIQNDSLLFAGKPISTLADEIGRTPFYAYNKVLIEQRIHHIRGLMPDELKLYYAVKANPMPALVKHLAPLVDGFDVASAGELLTTLGAGARPSRCSFAGPGKSEAELKEAIQSKIVISVESETELDKITKLGEQTDHKPRIAVRVNPDFELKTSGMKMGGVASPFGIDAEYVPAMLSKLKRTDIDFQGFHVYAGSQCLRADAIVELQMKTLDLLLKLSQDAPVAPATLNIGGGFGIPYFPGDEPLDLEYVGEHLGALMERVKTQLPNTDIVIELGRYLVGEAGIYVCRIIDRKISRGQVFLVTDGGMHHHLAASGNFGQVLRRNYPVIVGNKVRGAERESASIVGPLCTPLDLLADKIDIAKAEVGDFIVVFQSGAYGLTASPTAFLSHPPPAEILL